MLTLKSEELVPGDVVVLEAGDAVPADGRILESASLKVEEAALTGESVPVDKAHRRAGPEPTAKTSPWATARNMVYMGSTVVYGRGRAVGHAAPAWTPRWARLPRALAQAEEGQTPLQKKLAQLSQDPYLAGAGHLRIYLCVQPDRGGRFPP